MMEVRYPAGDKEVRLIQDPRFGHWSIKLDAGELADCLRGTYLTLTDAKRAATEYFTSEKSRWYRRESPNSKIKINEIRQDLGLKEL